MRPAGVGAYGFGHDPTVPESAPWHDRDAAYRWYDAVRLHQLALSRDEILAKRYMVVFLANGGTDQNKTAYASKDEVIEHHHNGALAFFPWQIPLESQSARVCDVMLHFERRAYANGWRPRLGGPDLIVPTRQEDMEAALNDRRRL